MDADVFELLATQWPHLPPAVKRAEEFGSFIDAFSRSVTRRDARGVVGHLGLMEIPLRVCRRDLDVISLHAGIVREDARGQGVFRELMDEAIALVDRAMRPCVLWTETPAIYPRWGFRVVTEYIFEGPIPKKLQHGGRSRLLDVEDGKDRALLLEALAHRTPVSEMLGTRDPGRHFLLDLCLWKPAWSMVRHVPSLDAIVLGAAVEGTFRLVDVIARQIPPLSRLLPHIAQGCERIELFVTPDLLGDIPLQPRPHPSVTAMMVRGNPGFPSPSAIPLLSR